MKKILLFASLLLASMATFAQVPDASGWKKGDEITTEIGWGNLCFKNDPCDYWQFPSGSTNTGGLFEVWNGSNVDLYQVVQLPAGMYRLTCQGYYRCGDSDNEDPKRFDTDEWADNALLYAQNGTYDTESEAFTPAHTFKSPLMPRLFLNYPEQIYEKTGDEPDWMSDGNYGDKGWGPCSVPGGLAWFGKGLYAPEDDAEGRYNSTTFWLKEDGYVKIGISKKENVSGDSFMVTNFKMYYEGEVDSEMAEFMVLQEEVQELYDQLEAKEDMYNGEGLIHVLIFDNMPNWDPSDLETLDACKEGKAELEALLKNVEKAEAAYKQLKSVLSAMELLAERTDYAGKDDFKAALIVAQNCIDPDYEVQETDNFDSFQQAYDNLIAARVAYLQTQEKVDGVYDFTALIAYPWFCNPEYEPTWDEEYGAYKYADDIEETWARYRERGINDIMNDQKEEGWTNIASDVTWTQKSGVTGEWIYKQGGMGGVGHCMQHGYIAVSAWSANTVENPQEMRQTITGLPAGYYSMGALYMNAGGAPEEGQFVYINAGAEPDDATMEKAQFTHKSDHFWWGQGNGPTNNSGDIKTWRTDDWQPLRTNMVYVGEDGIATIGIRSVCWYATTGFHLYYYGATPDFASLLKPMYDEAKTNIEENLTWEGDIKKANALLAAADIENITDGEGLIAAQAAIAEANNYANTASAVVKKWEENKNFDHLAKKYEDGTPEGDIVGTAMMESLMIGTGENDTYELAIQNDKDYAAYVAYLDFRASMGELIKYDAVAKVVEEQNQSLIAKMANDQKLAKMQAALGVPYNRAVFASLNAADATAEQPLDITSLIVNPDFTESPSKGWSCEETPEINKYGRGNAELYNKSPFTFSQKLAGLPAGTYELRVKAIYRDGGSVTKELVDNYLFGAGEDEEWWDNHNAELFAKVSDDNDKFSYIKAIESLKTNETTFTYVATAFDKEEQDDGTWFTYATEFEKIIGTEIPDDEIYGEPVIYEQSRDWQGNITGDFVEGVYPFDTKITIENDEFEEETRYYPSSMQGFYQWCMKAPEAVSNSVQITIEDGETLEIGIRKTAAIGSDWVIFDDFQLFYLSGDTFKETVTGIEEAVAPVKKGDKAIYNLAGQKVDASYKGIVIQDGVKRLNK